VGGAASLWKGKMKGSLKDKKGNIKKDKER
jgi:hypothetical protein